MREEPLCYGEQGRGIAVVTLPDKLSGAPLMVFLNAGLLHRSEPFGLNVMLSRALAENGCISVRVDLSGRGDTPLRKGLTPREYVSADWGFLKNTLFDRFGERPIIFMGLCSGADNAQKLAVIDPHVKGLVLLDPVIQKDKGFSIRALKQKYLSINRWKNAPGKLKSLICHIFTKNDENSIDLGELRDLPTSEETAAWIDGLVRSDGRLLAVFSSYSLGFYNIAGQWSSIVNSAEFSRITTEYFFPFIDHVYSIHDHRDLLVEKVSNWYIENREAFK
jgi:hypothetical protein